MEVGYVLSSILYVILTNGIYSSLEKKNAFFNSPSMTYCEMDGFHLCTLMFFCHCHHFVSLSKFNNSYMTSSNEQYKCFRLQYTNNRFLELFLA